MARRREVKEVETVIEESITSTSAPARRVIAVRLTEDGKVDTGSMRQSTLDALKGALAGTSFGTQESGSEEQAASLEAKKQLYAQIVPAMYAVLGAAESLIVAKKTELPYNEVRNVMAYSDAEIALLTEPTAAVLAKRMPEGFGWAEEVSLGLILLSVHQQKVIALQEVRARNEKKLVDIRRTGTTDEPKDSIGE